MTQLRIRISLVARFGTMVETMVASPYVSALLRFAAARFETLAETMVASPYVSALLSFAAARFEALAETITFRVTQVRC